MLTFSARSGIYGVNGPSGRRAPGPNKLRTSANPQSTAAFQLRTARKVGGVSLNYTKASKPKVHLKDCKAYVQQTYALKAGPNLIESSRECKPLQHHTGRTSCQQRSRLILPEAAGCSKPGRSWLLLPRGRKRKRGSAPGPIRILLMLDS